MTKIMKGGIAYNATSNMVALTQAEYNSLSHDQKNNGNFYFITDASPSYFSASNIDYDNTSSGIAATNIQDAIDETNSNKVSKSGDTMTGVLKMKGAANAQLLQSRSLVGINTDATSQDALYLQFGNSTNDDVFFGASGGGKIHTNGTQYTGNSATATTATTATTASKVAGTYSGRGGQQGPGYYGKNYVGFLMSNATVSGDSHYKNWLYMDCYSGTDVGGATALGLDRMEPRMFIMQSDANRTSWNNTAAVGVFTATPTSGNAVVADGTTGGIKTITNNITGSGSTNYVPKFTGTYTIGNGFGTTTSVTSGSGSLVTSGAVYTALSNKVKRTSSSRNFTSKTTMSSTGLSVTCPAGHIYLVQAWFRYSNGAPRYVAACHSNTVYTFYDSVAASTDAQNAGHSSLSFILTPGETIYYWAQYYSATANFISESIIDITL